MKKRINCTRMIWRKGWISPGLYEVSMNQDDVKKRILFFKSPWCKIASVSRNWINSAPQKAATTFCHLFCVNPSSVCLPSLAPPRTWVGAPPLSASPRSSWWGWTWCTWPVRDYRIVDYCKHVAVVSGEQMRKILQQVHTFHSIPLRVSFISGKYTPFTLYRSASLSSRFWCSCWWFLSFLNRIRLNSLNLILKYLNVSQSTHQQREIIC